MMSPQLPQVTIPNTEVQMFSSSIVNQEFKIFVALPRHYTESEKRYPVLYVLDANMFFGMVTETVRLLELAREVPEVIIVGIGYPVTDFLQTFGPRSRNFTPSVDDDYLKKWLEGVSQAYATPLIFNGTGGAGDFLQFIREELLPFVHSNYRANHDDITLVGGSHGGLFALYTLFHHPNTFNRYVIGSPSIWWDNKVTLTYEANYAASHSDLPAKVFMSVGSLEESKDGHDSGAMITNVQTLAKTLQDRRYDSFELKVHIFEEETHSSVISGVSKGLKAVFS